MAICWDMKNSFRAFTLLLLCIQVGVCLGSQETPEPEDYFATHIELDGTKKFQYTLQMEMPDGGAEARPGNAAGHVSGNSSRGVAGGVTLGNAPNRRRPARGAGRQSQYAMRDMVNTRLESGLEHELQSTGFCNMGYKEKERVNTPPTYLIRGECNEAATGEDLVRFPNQSD